MTNLGYNDAAEGLDLLKNNIDALPTTLDKVASQTQSFAPMVDNVTDAANVTLAWVNAMAAGGQSAEQQSSAVDAWTRAMAKGKVEMNEWEAIIRTAPGQMTQLSKALLGPTASYGDLYAALKAGEVSLEEVNDMMITMSDSTNELGGTVKVNGQEFSTFSKQAADASAGIQMASLNVKAALERNIANVLDTINETLGAGGLPGKIQSLVPLIDQIGSTIQGVLTGNISIDEALSTLLDWIGSFTREFVNSGADLIARIEDGMAGAAPAFLEKFGVVISNLLHTIGENAPMLIQSGINLVGNLVIGLIQGIPNVIIGGLNLLRGLVEGLGQGEGDIAEKIGEILANLVGAIIEYGPEILKAAWELAKAIGKAFMEVDWLSLGLRVIRGILTGISSVAPRVLEVVKGLVQKVLRLFGFDGLANRVGIAFESAKKSITGKLDAAKATIDGWIARVKGLFPFSLGKIFSGWFNLPSISLTKTSDGGARATSRNTGVQLAKAMNQPYLFRGSTQFYAGEAGDEMLMGRQALKNDLADAVKGAGGNIIINLNYQAGDDANDMLRDLARGIQRYKMAGVI